MSSPKVWLITGASRGFGRRWIEAPAYESIRHQLASLLTADGFGDPSATGEAILKVVDASAPPLRLILGSAMLPLIKQVYAERLKTWESWDDVSKAAQGRN